MTKKYYNEESIQDIADAIRQKNGSSNTYKVAEMSEAILNLTGAVLQELNVMENGIYTPTSGIDGFGKVTVNVSGGLTEIQEEKWYIREVEKWN